MKWNHTILQKDHIVSYSISDWKMLIAISLVDDEETKKKPSNAFAFYAEFLSEFKGIVYAYFVLVVPFFNKII